jgi:hypothetical protein
MSKRDKEKKLEERAKADAESGTRVSGEPENDLTAVGAGGVTGAAAGAAIGGAIGGPAGGAIGAAVGAVVGGAAADQIQNELDPKLEELYWQENFKHRPYYTDGDNYDVYLPAYRFGWEAAIRKEFAGQEFAEIEPRLAYRWQEEHGHEKSWNSVRAIVRDAYDRILQRHYQPVEAK